MIEEGEKRSIRNDRWKLIRNFTQLRGEVRRVDLSQSYMSGGAQPLFKLQPIPRVQFFDLDRSSSRIILWHRYPFMLPEILFAISLVVATVALFWYLARLAAIRVATQFEALAYEFELELTRREPQWLGFHRPETSLYGQYRGREISISVPGHGKQNTRQIETMLKVEVRDQRLSAQFNLKGWMASLEKKLSSRAISVIDRFESLSASAAFFNRRSCR